jgi:hypothetical protein
MYRFFYLVAVSTLFISGCAAPLRTIDREQLVANAGQFSKDYQQELKEIGKKSEIRIRDEYTKALETGKPEYFDILVLSGGGALGAFGAGFLQGWGEVGPEGVKRPDFDSVSGISTGALIAPFAFVGTDEAYSSIVELYRNPDPDMVVAKLLVSLLSANSAVYDATKLHERIRQGISPSIIESIVQKSYDNAVLLVGATNIDYGSMRVWDLADLAKKHSVDKAQELITERLIASSAIPGAFPPVLIDNNLYVDGGASMQVVSGIDDRSWLYEEASDTGLGNADSGVPVNIRIWIVVNNKLVMDPDVTTPTWDAIATRSLVSLMRGSTLQTIQDVETFAQLINKRPDFNVEMNYAAIPQSYEIPETASLFDQQKMRDLVELGRKMGKQPESWKQRAVRPGASILDLD